MCLEDLVDFFEFVEVLLEDVIVAFVDLLIYGFSRLDVLEVLD